MTRTEGQSWGVPGEAGSDQTCICVLSQVAQKQTEEGKFVHKRFLEKEGKETGERER